MLRKTISRRINHQLRLFSTQAADKPDVFMDIKTHGFLPNAKPLQELPA
jgi:indoleamine 2,3-dioxygenase